MLEVLTDHIRQSVVGAERFKAKYGVMVTWYQLPFYGVFPEDDCPVSIFSS